MANDDDKLESFKIGDLRRPEVRSTSRVDPSDEAPEPVESTGFPAIESRLESGDVEAVANELRTTYEKLEALAEGGSRKEKAAATKAMAAYERTADLFEYLFMTKQAMGPESE